MNAEEKRQYDIEYRRKNKDRIDARRKRYTSTPRAKELARARRKRWENKNPEAMKLARKNWVEVNPEKVRAINRRYAEKHRERRNARSREIRNPEVSRAYYRANKIRHKKLMAAWYEANPEYRKLASQKRRAKINANGGNGLNQAEWNVIKAAYQNRCAYCDRKMKRLTVDHIVPISKGGEHDVRNIVPACLSCNSRKNANTPSKPVPIVMTLT